jgi:hypothetical protein
VAGSCKRHALDRAHRAAYLRGMPTPSPADLLWQVHHAALEGRSSATGAPLTLDKAPPGAWMAHHAMACFEALRRGESMPARPVYLDDLRADIAEDVARKHAASFGPTRPPPPPPPPSIGPPDDPTPPPPPDYSR